ncbi:3-keto-disaccharide hydrolase [Marinimicrobium sp. ARAG 43.8]|uniref:3-keto-disaccharide hydrolase n=1 Tax=Marinimicrobium sp. ARAG 43.8 TaxID=3418719 RepID=UPI003CF29740
MTCLRTVSIATLGALCSLSVQAADWQPLLDEELSQWEIYLGYPSTDTEVSDLKRDEQGEYLEPVGYGRDEWNVFSVSTDSGEPVLRVSGEIYGGIFTRKDFSNYHLRLQIKWGSQKWQPRKELPLDTGILYHGQGEHGVDYWRAWPLSQEFQIVEKGVDGTTGDWWKIAHSQIDIRCETVNEDEPPVYSPTAPLKTFGGHGSDITCRASEDHEKPSGEWNTLDLITYGDKSLHIVNGEVVMALSGSSFPEDGEIKPLTEGQIVLQSEAGEAFFRRIDIKSIDGIPEQYQHYFE